MTRNIVEVSVQQFPQAGCGIPHPARGRSGTPTILQTYYNAFNHKRNAYDNRRAACLLDNYSLVRVSKVT